MGSSVIINKAPRLSRRLVVNNCNRCHLYIFCLRYCPTWKICQIITNFQTKNNTNYKIFYFNYTKMLFDYIPVFQPSYHIPYGLVARIPGFHPGGSGSIPGTGSTTF